jgi:hypothetical protein
MSSSRQPTSTVLAFDGSVLFDSNIESITVKDSRARRVMLSTLSYNVKYFIRATTAA